MTQHYPNLLFNAFKSVNAWKSAFLISAIVAASSVWALVWTATHQTVVLVPHLVSSARGPVSVNTNAISQESAYLGMLAVSDLHLLLTWNSDNVGVQYARALNRMDSSLYAARQVELTKEAERHAAASISQVFYTGPVSLLRQGVVQVDGNLVRMAGDKQLLNTKATYEISYTIREGVPYVSSIESK